jgi:RNA polymerase sigma factor (TIGR02999 family)
VKTSKRPSTSHSDERRAQPLADAFPRAYDDLRSLAEHLLRRRRGAPLHTTSLVHETWLRLARGGSSPVRDDEHLLALAARAMRCVLVDHARRRAALKRGGPHALADAGELAGRDPLPGLDCVALHEALERLAALDERKARVVELRFFGGLEIEEIASVLAVSPATVKRDWPLAKAWLYRELGGEPGGRA